MLMRTLAFIITFSPLTEKFSRANSSKIRITANQHSAIVLYALKLLNNAFNVVAKTCAEP